MLRAGGGKRRKRGKKEVKKRTGEGQNRMGELSGWVHHYSQALDMVIDNHVDSWRESVRLYEDFVQGLIVYGLNGVIGIYIYHVAIKCHLKAKGHRVDSFTCHLQLENVSCCMDFKQFHYNSEASGSFFSRGICSLHIFEQWAVSSSL